ALSLVKNREKHWQSFKNSLKLSKSKDEVDKIIACLEFPANPIIEKLNMLLYFRGKSPEKIRNRLAEYLKGENKQYSRLYQKNAFNLLFQLYSDYPPAGKKYTGIDVFINLSSGIIRFAIEICNQALNNAYNYGYEPNKENPVGVLHQDFGAKYHAKLQYNDVLRIPGNLGLPVQEFINQIGTIFRALHMDQYLVEPEPTHFETNYSEISGKAKKVFDAAIKYSCLQVKPPMDPKSYIETKKTDFLTNRVFAPHFEISYRLRGRTPISASQINRLITGNPKEKRQTRGEIVRNKRVKRKRRDMGQKQLVESDWESGKK
ncbi:hypothetical protein HQ584_10305, partial [Patescibacteria group bacterium]|nr:hypothetical protein [Patescibacteria group bacterium]